MVMRLLATVGLVSAAAVLSVGAAGGSRAWCGSGESASDRLPDAVAAQQIHVLYAFPSDGDDHFAADAPLIVSDLEALDGWWQREDPTRVARFDLYAFPGCSNGLDALDLSSVRLPHDTAYYQPIDGRSDKLRADLAPAFANPSKKELVYYDAPVDTPFDCGQSAIAPDTSAFSFVYLLAQGCTHDLGAGGGTAGYTAHELLHNLGAVPAEAPHFCYEHSVCDWYWDVEMQFPTGDPISKLVLDYGRDDYYGHSGSWFDVQDSPWLSHVGSPLEPLAVDLAGKGQGSVASDLPGIACPGACTIGWEQGTAVVLQATAASGSRFLAWSGPCTGAAECGVTVSAPTRVTATFAPAVVSLAVTIRGRGTVVSAPRGIACPPRCSRRFASGTTVVLRPKPRTGWRLVRCACRVYLDGDKRAAVTFRRH